MTTDTTNPSADTGTSNRFVNSDWKHRLRQLSLLGLLAFILFNRIRNYSNIRQPGGRILFPSVDGWYHRRATIYTVEHYPKTLNFDPYSGFDAGNQVGQFGTLFDQFLATVALLVGQGNPSTTTIDLVLAFTPPLLATITAIVIYSVATEITNGWGGIAAVSILALTPGLFLSHSMVGFIDHHIAETFLVSTSLLCTIKFTSTARNSPSLLWKNLRTHPFKSPILWSLFAGITNGVYLLIWPPGLLYIAILSVFLAGAILSEYLRETHPLSLSIGGAVMMISTSLLVLPFISRASLSVTAASPIQVLLPLGIGIGCLVLGYTAELAGSTRTQKTLYIASLCAVGSIAIALLYLVKPNLIQFFIRNSSRIFWFIGESHDTKIVEATTLSNPFKFGFVTYGFALFTAISGWIWMAWTVVTAERQTADLLLFSTFGIFMTSATITQPRFDYYLVIAVAVTTAYTFYKLYGAFNQQLSSRDIGEPDVKSNLFVTTIALIVIAPLVLSAAPIVAADSYTEPPSSDRWRQSFDWIESETPEFGEYGSGPSNPVAYNGEFNEVEDYEYQEGQYGILTRWSIGHRITVETHRVPVSNPHQQHSTVAADTVLAPSENAALNTMNSELNEGEGVRYVVLGKPWGTGNVQGFTAPAASQNAYDINSNDLGTPIYASDGESFLRYLQTERSYRSLRTRLYQFHGSAAQPSTYVIFSNGSSPRTEDGVVNSDIDIAQYRSVDTATAAAAGNPNAIQGGLYGEPPHQVKALQHFRLVHASEETIPENPVTLTNEHSELPSTNTPGVKTFERVPGASITGTGPENATIKAQVKLRITTTGETFTYTQYANVSDEGTFQLTVPYATTRYDQYTTEQGFTNTSIRAVGPYQISTTDEDETSTVTVDVAEGAVLGEEKFNSTVRLNE